MVEVDPNNTVALSVPPFVVVDGVMNIRAVGGFATSSVGSTDIRVRYRVKAPSLFRSGEPSRITEAGKEAMHTLRIQKIFDMRMGSEIRDFKTATPSIAGVEFMHVPVAGMREDREPEFLAERMAKFASDPLQTFLDMYGDILKNGGSSFGTIFRHLRDAPESTCLIHCTAGKDRTGLAVALFLMLLGVDDKDIIEDYTLTSVGLAPLIPILMPRFWQIPVYRDNWEGTQNMGTSRPETMAATLDMIRTEYGGVEEYLKNHTDLVDGDFQQIRRNFLVEA